MFGLVISLFTIFLLVYMLYKKVNPQAALLVSGFLLMASAIVFGLGDVIAQKQSLGLAFFDMFEVVKVKMSKTLAGLGLTLMSIAGFSAYMDHIGASHSLFKVFEKPLRAIKSPYVLLIISFFVIQILVIFIPSHSGLGMLLMVTLYPILIRKGVSKLSALGVIGTCQFIDHGPGSGNVIMSSTISEIQPAVYFVEHQLPITIPIIIAVAITHYFVQRYFDRKDGFVFCEKEAEAILSENETTKKAMPPLIYAILPIIPLVLILAFSKVFGSPIKMNVPVAMLISTITAIVFECIRYKSIVETLNTIMLFFKGMGHMFVITVSLIICGQVFAAGLISVGAVDTLMNMATNAGLGVMSIIVFMSLLLAVAAFLMGSGNAAFFSFAPLVPKIAKSLNVETITILLPAQIMTSFGRVASPITAAIVAIASMANVSPFAVVKRTFIPMIVAGIVNLIMTYIYL